jgi:hypothetical protein
MHANELLQAATTPFSAYALIGYFRWFRSGLAPSTSMKPVLCTRLSSSEAQNANHEHDNMLISHTTYISGVSYHKDRRQSRTAETMNVQDWSSCNAFQSRSQSAIKCVACTFCQFAFQQAIGSATAPKDPDLHQCMGSRPDCCNMLDCHPCSWCT